MQPIQNQADVDQGLQRLLALVPELTPIANQCGQLPLRLQQGGFAGLARIVIGQQVSTASAAAIHARFLEHIIPNTPSGFLDAGEPAWITIGLSRPKQRTLRALSEALIEGTLKLDSLATIDARQAIEILTDISGIGPWTAEVYLLFCCGHPDVFPAGDLALQESAKLIFALENRPSEKQLRVIADQWAPYKGIAARLLWAYYSFANSQKQTLPL